MIYAGYVKVVPGKPQTGRVKLKISRGSGEAKFSLGEGKNALGRVSVGLLRRDVLGSRCLHHTFSLFDPLTKKYFLRSVGLDS